MREEQIREIFLDKNNSRAFGWVQDSGNLSSLCDVVSVFDSESAFHSKLVSEIIPRLISEKDGRNEILSAMSARPLSLKYRMLIGTAFNPRSSARCNGIIQAAVKGQKRDYISDWPADNFIRWAHALGFIKYDYGTDCFCITAKGLELSHADSEHQTEIIENIILSYPPAYRVLSLLSDPDTSLTKFEIGAKLGFSGEDGFISYPLRSIVAALASAKNSREKSEIRSDWESSSDKYARTIAQWLKHLGFVENCTKTVKTKYAGAGFSADMSAFRITPKGERALKNAKGNSRHPRIHKIVSYEMFATKGKDREYLRLRRSYILKFLYEKNRQVSLSDISEYLKSKGLDEQSDTIKDDIAGLNATGIDIYADEHGALLEDKIIPFEIPVYKIPGTKSELSKEKDIMRTKLKKVPHEYLVLMDLAYDPKQNRLFEIKSMDLFINEFGFCGTHLGGASRPDGILYADFSSTEADSYGIITDMKAYSKGYDLPISQQDEMRRYIGNNQKRDAAINPSEWWKEFPESIKNFYFMFVSGSFKGKIDEKLRKIFFETNVSGTAMAIKTALLAAEKIRQGQMSLADFAKGINNTEYNAE